MESETTDRCSWCHREFTTQSATTSDVPGVPGTAPEVAPEREQTTASAYADAPPVTRDAPQALSAHEAPTPSQEEEAASPHAPWLVSGPAPAEEAAPSNPPSAPSAPRPSPILVDGKRPIIGVRRPGSAGKGGSAPAQSVPPSAAAPTHTQTPPPSVSRPTLASGPSSHIPAPPIPAATPHPPIDLKRAGEPTTPHHAPAPPVPPAAPTIPGVRGRQAVPLNPQAAPAAPPASAIPPVRGSSAPAAAPDSTLRPSTASPRPAVPAALIGGATTPTVRMPAGQPGVAQTAAATAPAASLPQTKSAPVLLGDVEDSPPPSPVQAAAELHVPPFGTFQPVKSKYYTGQVIDPISGTHYDAETGLPTNVNGSHPASKNGQDIVLHWDDSPAMDAMQLMRYAGVFALILAVAGFMAHALPNLYVVPLLASQFLGGLLLPLMKVVPWAEDDSDHIFLFFLLTLALGPMVALIAYGVISLLRQDASPGMVGCLSVAFLAQVAVGMAAGDFSWSRLTPFSQMGHFEVGTLFLNWSGLLALAGWYTASIFRRPDE
ncbi:MAG TPA: hypothetical protein VFB38_15350 [Chthonomonadaceae bacterium]|nr:hypothetical protein [Chthonomonadaceae bacterium]